ncbi:hypothetical protein ACH4YO_23440 [Streptomyces noursei]|uniref:hypothetical protein n=1 Tax=Streptomyces noursei TaxID=1971 RepID=UPI0033E3BDBC
MTRLLSPRLQSALQELMTAIRANHPHVRFRIHISERFDRVFLCPTIRIGEFLEVRRLVEARLNELCEKEGLDITVNLAGDPTIDPSWLEEDAA